MNKVLPILLFICNFCHAQNYQCLQTGAKHYFTNSQGYLRGIRIDSVIASGSDSIYYPFHTLRGYYPHSAISGITLDSTGGSWLGKNVIRQSDGTYLFDNLWHDTIVIKTQANPGDSWVFYNDTTSLYYKAELTAKDTMTVLGTIDSVKRILITAHNPSGIVTADPVDSFTITLSKSHGFVQVFDLYTFPYHAPDSAYRPGLDYYLDYALTIGTTPTPTFANSIFSLTTLVAPTIAELTQWNAGDVYEYSSCQNLFEHMGGACLPVEFYSMDSVNFMTTSPGLATYHCGGWIANFNSPTTTGPSSYAFSFGPADVTADSTLVIDTTYMPEEFGQSTILNSGLYIYKPNDTSYCVNGPLYARLGYGFTGFIYGAKYYSIFEHYVGPTLFKAPLGLLSGVNSSAGSSGYLIQSRNLLYYNRGGVSCGSLVIPPSEVSNINTPKTIITIGPNPAHDLLDITCTNEINDLEIYNMFGEVVYKQEPGKRDVQVRIANLPNGVYTLRLNRSVSKRFVKE